MNTLIEIALTTQPLKARYSPTVELLCPSWERSCVQMAPYTPGNMRTHAHTQKKKHDNFSTYFTQLFPNLLINTHREPHTPPSIK